MRLPKRQREALELRERERLSYEEIAASMGVSVGSVAQLIARARINLYDELRGTPLASIAAPPDCERALPLIAAREDGQLDDASSGDDADWLDAHLEECDRCRAAAEQMSDAAASYRGDVPPAEAHVARTPKPERTSSPRRWVVLAASAVAVLLLAGLAAAFISDDGPAPSDPATEAAALGPGGGEAARRAKPAEADSKKDKAAKRKSKSPGDAITANDQTAAGEAALPSPIEPVPSAEGRAPNVQVPEPSRSSGKTAVGAPKQITTPKSGSNPKPAPSSTPTSQPASVPPAQSPPPEAPPAEEPPDAPGRSGEAPGKPDDRPSRK